MASSAQEVDILLTKINSSSAPASLKERIVGKLQRISRLTSSPSFFPELDRISSYIDWITRFPWEAFSQDNLDVARVRDVLDKNHFGLSGIKDRIVEYVSVMKLKKEKGEEKEIYRAPILCFVGLVGTGKTTIAASIAEALGRNFARIPFGGMEDPLDLRGKSNVYPEGEPGKVIKSTVACGYLNSVILLDEIDRVTDRGRSAIMGVLVELLDPEQNNAFTDHYFDYPVDLSSVLFIATANNTTNISTAVLDRIEPISMPSYTDFEKITIGSRFILPRTNLLAGIPEGALTIEEDVWPSIVRPLGYDAGIRTLERTIEGIVRKVARLIVAGKGESFHITTQNVKEFIPQ